MSDTLLPRINFSKHYIYKSVIDLKEDDQHGFIAGRQITCKDGYRGKSDFYPVSRTVGAIINRGNGGYVYLGVLHDGIIIGLEMNPPDMTTFICNLNSTLSAYTPSVPDDQVEIMFVPVIPSSEFDIQAMKKSIIQAVMDYDKILSTPPNPLGPKRLDPSLKSLSFSFVIEIKINPWLSSVSSGSLDLHPVYEDENNEVYIRLNGKDIHHNLSDLINFTESELELLKQ